MKQHLVIKLLSWLWAGLRFALLASLLLVLLYAYMPVWISGIKLERHLQTFWVKMTAPHGPLPARQGLLQRPSQHQWVSLARISPHMAQAVVAAEDQRFLQHSGFDFVAIEKAWQANLRGKRLRGGSTLSQQTAKNVFLWSGRSYIRKGLEAYFTVLIEAGWGKSRILEVYLNTVEFGTGIFGVEAAARHYFGVPAARLSASQAALLAAVLPNPHRFLVQQPSPYIKQRQQFILRQMRQTPPVIQTLRHRFMAD
jgi:monofunctional biosynthetic peptidoglycan transglycosylase